MKLTIISMLLFAIALPLAAADAATKPEPTLYERLGGVYAIATVVNDFIDTLAADETLNANPNIAAARKHVPLPGLKFQVTALVSQLTGGPQVYNGRSMKDAHAHLHISEKEWDAMVADFVKTLTKYNVPQKEQQELLALVAPAKKDIVTAP